MIVEQTIVRARKKLQQWRQAGDRIGLVPTMGYFHAGHLALMKKAGEAADRVVVSLFVNPTQFGPADDFRVYPRDFAGDCEKARACGVDLLFCPDVTEMYGVGDQTTVSVDGLSQGLCGDGRPGHFRGVTTVVTKLFNVIAPDCAVFGEKDFQQLAVIRRLVADLHLPVQIIGHPTVREPDGLAMSSRNVYLTPDEHRAALILYRSLLAVKKEVAKAGGRKKTTELREIGRRMIDSEPLCAREYFTIVDGVTLEECIEASPVCRVLGAIRVGSGVRLIDNLPL